MKITRKREIILQRERRITIKFNDESSKIFCVECNTAARFITADEAAAICETSAREIFKLVENGQIHFQETAQGKLLVCLVSLTNLPNESRKLPAENYE